MTTLNRLLQRTYQNLQILTEKEAKLGGTPDLKLLNEIEDHRRAIALMEEARATPLTEAGLRQLKEALRPLLIAGNVESLDVDTLALELPLQSYEPETILIPAGPFLMGSSPGENIPAEETPLHEVILPAYRIGRYPVTNAQYAAFVQAEKGQEVPKKTGWFLREPPADKLDHPVVAVSWYDARAYCDWLSVRTGRLYRLPTEAEWEKAARGEDGRPYPWGKTWEPDRCNTAGDETTPVTTYPEGLSPYGCGDMAGNVQEWTSTLWGSDPNQNAFPYPYRPSDGREDPTAEQRLHRVYRLVRGGSFRDEPARLRCYARSNSAPDSRVRWRGFRVVLEL